MSKRTERRAAEREARKNAFQQLRLQRTTADPTAVSDTPLETQAEPAIADLFARAQAFFQTEPEQALTPEPTPVAISEAQRTANRANAQLSTGPVSIQGKAASSKNALKTGLTGQTVLLPTDNVEQYNCQLNATLQRFQPVGEEEHRLVQSVVDSLWRLRRIQRLEAGILLKGQLEFANKFEDQPAGNRAQLIDVETYLKYEKSIRNLHIQESRLHRRMDKDTAELTRLQTVRKRDERMAADQPNSTIRRTNTPDGFDFSTPKYNSTASQRRSSELGTTNGHSQAFGHS